MSLSFDSAEALIYEFCKTYPQALTITFNLAQTQEELYGPQNTVALRGRIDGSYRPASQRADFALANCDSNDEFERTLRHEILGHFGLNTFDPGEKRAVLTAIIEARSQAGLDKLWAHVDRHYPGLDDMRKAEEVFAFACEDIDSNNRSASTYGSQSFQEVCVKRSRALRLSDLINLTTLVAEGLHDRSRSQQTFPASDSAQFKQDTPMNTSEYTVWLAVLPDDREKMRTAAGQLSDGRAAVEWSKEEKLWFARPGADLDRINEWLPDRSIRAGGGDPESEFLDVLTQAGLVVKGMPVMNGQRQRVSTTDDKSGKKSGVYCGFLDRRPGGWFINYHRADNAKDVTNWVSSGGEADPVARIHIRAAAKQAQEDAARDRAAKYAKRTLAAKEIYDRLPAADPSHPYLVRKGITPTPEIRQTRNGALVVPFFDAQGNFKTLQYIPEAGEKLLFKDAPKQGHFLVVGGALKSGQPIQYAEGYATARSLNMATGRPVVMTIDAGNMVAVAQILHQLFPTSQHLFMADFDHAKDVNKGLLMASEAAELVGGQVLYPTFTEAEIAQGITDFNDLHQSRGLEAVRDQTAHLFKRNDEVPTVSDEQTLHPKDPVEPAAAKPAGKRAAKKATVEPADKALNQAAEAKPDPERAPRPSASKSAVSASVIESPPSLAISSVTVDQSLDQGPRPLNFTFSGQPASLNLQDYQPGKLPDATVVRPIERMAPPMPHLTYNGQPARLNAETARDSNEQTVIAPVTTAEPASAEPSPVPAKSEEVNASDNVPSPAEAPVAAVLNDQADVAISGLPENPAIQATPMQASAEISSSASAESATQAQTAEAPSDVKGLTAEHLKWAQSQPWFNGLGQDDDGEYVFAREQSGKQVQWKFRNAEELRTWAEQQLRLASQEKALPDARPSAAVDLAQPEVSADAIHVGPRVGIDEPSLQSSSIDKDALLTRITHEPQPDNSVLYKLDDQPAFVDRGSRLEMVPGAGQSDEKIMAALLTAARFYRGQIELTGSDAFKAKAIELIAEHRVNVTMKNPAQQLMLDQARQLLNVPSVKPDTIVGDPPQPYDPALPVVPALQPSLATVPVPQQHVAPVPSNPEVHAQPASTIAVSQVVQKQYAPLQVNDLGSPALAPVQAGTVDDAPTMGLAEKVDPAVHQPAEEAAHGITGKVLACGKAPFRFDPENTESVYIKLRTKTGVQTFWGKELAGVLRDSRIQPGRLATLQWLGKKPVTINVPVKDPDTGKTVRYEEKNTHRNQWDLTPENGATVRTGDDQGVKLVAYDANRFAMIQNSVLAQVNVSLDPPVLPNDGLFWMTPNGQGSAKAGDELSAARPAVDSNDAGKPLISSWSADGQLDMALFRGDGPYLQGVVRHGDGYQHVLVSLPGDAKAPPMVFNAITEHGLVPIGAGNAINRSGDQPVAREHIAFKLEGDSTARIGKLDFPAEVPPALHHRLGFDERWKDTNTLPKSAPAAAPKAQPSAMRPS